MLFAFVHLRPATHSALNDLQSPWQPTVASQGFQKKTSCLAYDVGEFDETPLGIAARAKSKNRQCWRSKPISLASTSQRMRQGWLVRHSSRHPYGFHSLKSSSICQRSRTSTRASCRVSWLAGTAVAQKRPVSQVQCFRTHFSLPTCRISDQSCSALLSHLLRNTYHQESHEIAILICDTHPALVGLPNSLRKVFLQFPAFPFWSPEHRTGRSTRQGVTSLCSSCNRSGPTDVSHIGDGQTACREHVLVERAQVIARATMCQAWSSQTAALEIEAAHAIEVRPVLLVLHHLLAMILPEHPGAQRCCCPGGHRSQSA